MGNLLWTSPTPTPTLAQLQTAYVARQWGMFIHFNMSTFVDLEWAVGNESVNTFNPTLLNIDQWVSTAQAGKFHYAILTSKHHDGFCLWPSATTTRDVAATSWYASNGHVDILGQYLAKFRAVGITPLIYFSVWDHTFEMANPGFTQAAYRAYLEAQLTELLTNYGTIPAIWMDGAEPFLGFNRTPANIYYPWDTPAQRNNFIRGLQRDCVVIDNAHDTDFAKSDIIIYEGGTFGAAVPSNNVNPAELADTLRTDGNWFWKSTGNPIRTASEVLSAKATVNSRNATMVLNAGPDTTGNIPANMVAVLTTVGASL